MRFMIVVKATEESEAGKMPGQEVFDAMADYHEELAGAGVLLDASGLHPSSKGWRIEFGRDGSRTVVDGPFAETKELIAGYTIIDVSSPAEAKEWARRFPNPGSEEGSIEVRPLFELDDFEQGPAIDRFREMQLPSQTRQPNR